MPSTRRKTGLFGWVQRIALALGVMVVLTIAIGAAYEAWVRSTLPARFPAPGRLVDVGGGRRIHIDCRGVGSPTVVLQSGLDANGSLAWSRVREPITAVTRTCAYDRAGIMWSDPAAGPHGARLATSDLHAALAAAGERAPLVLVGHSLGGPLIMDYVHRYPADVAGVVLVDASHPDQVRRFRAAGLPYALPATGPLKLLAALSWTGWTRLPVGGALANLPPAAARAGAAWQFRSMGAALAELDALEIILAQGGTLRSLGPRPFGARPLVVLTAMKPATAATLKSQKLTAAQGALMQATWKSMQDDEASWSTRSRHVIAPDSTHYIQLDRPDLVVAAVTDVVGQVRSGVH